MALCIVCIAMLLMSVALLLLLLLLCRERCNTVQTLSTTVTELQSLFDCSAHRNTESSTIVILQIDDTWIASSNKLLQLTIIHQGLTLFQR
jgi:hypothetical protein